MVLLAVTTRMILYSDERFRSEVFKLEGKLIRNSMVVVRIKNAEHQLKNAQVLVESGLTV